jgi:ketosteroid isomerase-like protein
MRNPHVLVGLLLVLLASSRGSRAQGQSPTREDVAEEVRRRYTAFNSGPDAPANLDAILRVYPDEAIGFGYRTAAVRDLAARGADGHRRAIKQFLDSMEYYHLKFQELHTSVEGDIGLAWGVFVEDFKTKNRPPETAHVRFTLTLKKERGRWSSLLMHRDIQPFDEQGRYLTQFTRVP